MKCASAILVLLLALFATSSSQAPKRTSGHKPRVLEKIERATASRAMAEWCPGSWPPRGNVCQFLPQRFLFVWGTGRSGSTTLLNMLNSLPDVSLTGENDMLESAAAMYSKFSDLEKRNNDGAWLHGNLKYRHFNCALQNTFRSLGNADSTAIVGFKEIRFTPDMAQFLRDVFPCSKFVFNMREDLQAQIDSWRSAFPKARKKNETEIVNIVKTKNKAVMKVYSEMGPQQAYLMPLEKFTLQGFNDLVAWLGFSNCSFTSIVHFNDGGYAVSTKRTGAVKGACTHTMM